MLFRSQAAGFHRMDESTRKAIRRSFQKLVKEGVLEAQGTTRARLYSLKQNIQKPAKVIVGYQEQFLKSYHPNRTEYLSQADQLELFRAVVI